MYRKRSILVVAGVVLSDDDKGQVVAGLAADEVIWAVAASTAVGRGIANQVLAREGSSLVVDSEAEFGVLALGEAKAVVAVAAGDDLRRQLGDDADLAGKVGGIGTGELEASALDAVVLADVEVGNIDVLVCGWVRRRAATVSWVGAASCLRGWGCEGGCQKSRDGGECELHLVICVGEE